MRFQRSVVFLSFTAVGMFSYDGAMEIDGSDRIYIFDCLSKGYAVFSLFLNVRSTTNLQH
jgi:hypothetical protein